jgi:ketosteroid isomerase-like protein
MSQENVEVARRAMDALSRDGVGGLLPFLDTDVEWVSIPGFLPDAEDRRGHAGVVGWFEQVDELFDDTRWEAHELLDAGDRLMIVSTVSGRGKISGAVAEITLFHAVTAREGRVLRFESYLEREQALEAVGLRE